MNNHCQLCHADKNLIKDRDIGTVCKIVVNCLEKRKMAVGRKTANSWAKLVK
jgi:hypothetical protein